MNSDFKEILRIFNAVKVKYLVVGGYAVMKYTEPRFTKDLDIWVNPTPENAKLVHAALKEFGAPLFGATEETFTRKDDFLFIGVPPNRIDILKDIASGSGPRRSILALGYAGWGPGQLDQELQANAWLTVPADEELIFDDGLNDKWERSLHKIGVDFTFLTADAGHA